MFYLPSRPGNSRAYFCKVKAKLFLRVALAIFLIDGISNAQEVQSPPISAFKPDTSLPKVNIPEFVVTGKVTYELPLANKPSVEFDSTYFQNKQMIGTGERIHFARTLSDRYLMSTPHQSILFARIGFGHYQSTNYLFAGTSLYQGYRLNGGVSGFYTSGFKPDTSISEKTIERNFMFQMGIARDFLLRPGSNLSSLLSISLQPSSFYLYGSSHHNLIRRVSSLNVGLSGSTDLSDNPASMSLSFNRYSIRDSVNVSQYELGLKAESLFDLRGGNLHVSFAFSSGEHDVSSGQGLYLIKAGALYEKKISRFSVSMGLNFYQYKDDYSNGVGKLFPDFVAIYKFSDDNDVYLKYYGEVSNNNLSSLITYDRYLNSLTLLKYSEKYFNLIVGSNWVLNKQFSLVPQANLSLVRYLPTYYSDSLNDNFLHYSSQGSIFSFTFNGKYRTDFFGFDASLIFRLSKADSLDPVPNLPPYELKVSGNYNVTSRFRIYADLTFVSSRYSDITLVRKVSPMSLINGRLSYLFEIKSMPLVVFLDIRNLLNQKYFIWQGYQEFPLTLMLGVSSQIIR